MEPDCEKLKEFIKNNNLKLYSNFVATDMDGAYRIQENKKTGQYGWPKDDDDLCLSFVCYSEGFTWDLWDEKMFSRHVNEAQFIKELEEKVTFWKKDKYKTRNEFFAKQKIIDDKAYKKYHNIK